MAHASNAPLAAGLLVALWAGCSGEVHSADTQYDAGSGGTIATGGSGGGIGGGGGATAQGGAGGQSVDVPPPGQQILFEVSYENYAWGAQLNGMFITRDGSVFQYDHFGSGGGSSSAPPPATLHATEAELRARWGLVTGPVAQLPLEIVAQHFSLVEPVARGVVLSSYACADAGETTYLGYLYDPGSATYARVTAGIEGGTAARNVATGAQELVTWLSGIAGTGGGGCTFRGAACLGAVCAQPQPDCPPGFVPSVDNGCWGDCVPATHCLEVLDCTWCDDSICATSEAGSSYCVPMVCSGLAPCDCPASPCGGGADYCTPASGARVACGPV